jgi:hypothetical protein
MLRSVSLRYALSSIGTTRQAGPHRHIPERGDYLEGAVQLGADLEVHVLGGVRPRMLPRARI